MSLRISSLTVNTSSSGRGTDLTASEPYKAQTSTRERWTDTSRLIKPTVQMDVENKTESMFTLHLPSATLICWSRYQFIETSTMPSYGACCKTIFVLFTIYKEFCFFYLRMFCFRTGTFKNEHRENLDLKTCRTGWISPCGKHPHI